MNRKGFMMAELVVVSSIIVISLTGLYISYNKIITSYRQVINYYEIGLYYKLGYYNMKLYKNGFKEKTLAETLNSIAAGKYLDITEEIAEQETGKKEYIYIVRNNAGVKALKDAVENQTYKEYLDYLLNSKNIGNGYFIIGEQCLSNKKKSDKTKCKYAYTEVTNA